MKEGVKNEILWICFEVHLESNDLYGTMRVSIILHKFEFCCIFQKCL